MIYGRSYEGDKYCPACGSSKWQDLKDCSKCCEPVCSACGFYLPVPHRADKPAPPDELLCKACYVEAGHKLPGKLRAGFAEGSRMAHARQQLQLVAMPATLECPACGSTVATAARDLEIYRGKQCCEGRPA